MRITSHSPLPGSPLYPRAINDSLAFLLPLLLIPGWTANSLVLAQEPVNRGTQSNRIQLMEATIECGWGYIYSVSSATYTAREQEWLRSILRYLNNGEVNRPRYTFEAYVDNGLATSAINNLMADRNFRGWAKEHLLKAIRELILYRKRLLSQPPQFFEPGHMTETSLFKAYWKAREDLIEVLKQDFRVAQDDNGVDCD